MAKIVNFRPDEALTRRNSDAEECAMSPTTSLTWIEPGYAALPQISPADVAALAAQGVRMVINNRPDGESPGQPAAA
ncbi:MAG: beta-lactamase hydrolase domain-containing protein, partial [Sphingomonadaceae bacterium]